MAPGVPGQSVRLAGAEVDAVLRRQSGDVVTVEGGQDEVLIAPVVPSEPLPGVGRIPSTGDNDTQSILVQAPHGGEERQRRSRISPVQILDDDYDGATLLAAGPGAQDLLAGGEASFGVRPELAGQLVGNFRGELVSLGPDRHALFRDVTCGLADESGLARTGLALDPHQGRSARHGAFDGGQEGRDLLGATDEGEAWGWTRGHFRRPPPSPGRPSNPAEPKRRPRQAGTAETPTKALGTTKPEGRGSVTVVFRYRCRCPRGRCPPGRGSRPEPGTRGSPRRNARRADRRL
jgi:hypothetical protein